MFINIIADWKTDASLLKKCFACTILGKRLQ